jgi:hypothetical protein
MSASDVAILDLAFVWLGMVLAISFLEAPIKFRAPGVTLQIGLGIGRMVFRALNAIEVALAVGILIAVLVDVPRAGTVVSLAVAGVMLMAQLAFVRPRLTRRSNAVLAGSHAPRSHAHYAYVGLELVKVAALIVGGVLLSTS